MNELAENSTTREQRASHARRKLHVHSEIFSRYFYGKKNVESSSSLIGLWFHLVHWCSFFSVLDASQRSAVNWSVIVVVSIAGRCFVPGNQRYLTLLTILWKQRQIINHHVRLHSEILNALDRSVIKLELYFALCRLWRREIKLPYNVSFSLPVSVIIKRRTIEAWLWLDGCKSWNVDR